MYIYTYVYTYIYIPLSNLPDIDSNPFNLSSQWELSHKIFKISIVCILSELFSINVSVFSSLFLTGISLVTARIK
jgi:hypothetical protein